MIAGLAASTRVRLARNLKGYPYRGLTAGQYKEIADKIWNALQTAPAIAADFTMTEIRPHSAEGAALVEKHLISPELAQSGGWLIASRDGGVAIMVGEEDHMRLQVIGSGLCPKECMAEARRLAALIEGQVPMDFSETLGYLTACPSNLGTGLRASIMLHLPLLGGAGRMQDVIAAAGRQGFTVRGAYGEGSKAVGGFYQLSNQVTLGMSEDAIVGQLVTLATDVIGQEKQLREQLRSRERDRACRPHLPCGGRFADGTPYRDGRGGRVSVQCPDWTPDGLSCGRFAYRGLCTGAGNPSGGAGRRTGRTRQKTRGSAA